MDECSRCGLPRNDDYHECSQAFLDRILRDTDLAEFILSYRGNQTFRNRSFTPEATKPTSRLRQRLMKGLRTQ